MGLPDAVVKPVDHAIRSRIEITIRSGHPKK